MVLQRGGSNSSGSKIWGYGALEDNSNAMFECLTRKGGKEQSKKIPVQISSNTWEINLAPQQAGDVCQLQITSGEETITLSDILFGDVWICSGQSNMEQRMGDIIDSEEEIANAASFSDIRFAIVQNAIAYEEDDDLDIILDVPWTDPSNEEYLKNMSAICFLYAKNIYLETGVPQGMVASDWGGTPIESWTNEEVLTTCNVPQSHDPCDICEGCYGEMYCYSVLWNAMINPLKRNFVKGFLWYQGETNGGYGGYLGFNRDYYQCTFPAMIDSWRKEFSENSMTDELAPFGFVQLAAWRPDSLEASFPVIRWHQTADYGYVPNERMENVFMAVALDTYDDKEGYPGNLHPRYKQIVAERLAIAGLNTAYDLNFPTNGPFPLSISMNGNEILITYDKDLTFNNNEFSGFYHCLSNAECDFGVFLNNWTEIGLEKVAQVSSNQIVVILEEEEDFWLSYIWRETPVLTYLGLPIYEDAEISLPSPPWKMLVENSVITYFN